MIYQTGTKKYINAGTGLPVVEDDLLKWCEKEENLVFLDSLGASLNFKKEVENKENVNIFSKTSGFTKNARERLSNIALNNIKNSK